MMKMISNTMSASHILLANSDLYKRVYSVQASNKVHQGKKQSSQNTLKLRTRDSTASALSGPKKPNLGDMRKRSRNSNHTPEVKFDSTNRQVEKEILGNHKVLEQYLNEKNQYNGIIRILDSEFLKAVIKRKSGNMTHGTNNETLDYEK